YDSQGQSEYNFTKPYSESTAELIDKEISKIVEAQYQRAISILEKNKDKLAELAELLLEKEVIFKKDLERVFGKQPYHDKEEEEEKKAITAGADEKSEDENTLSDSETDGAEKDEEDDEDYKTDAENTV